MTDAGSPWGKKPATKRKRHPALRFLYRFIREASKLIWAFVSPVTILIGQGLLGILGLLIGIAAIGFWVLVMWAIVRGIRFLWEHPVMTF